jgi:hypothetical protein
MTVENLSIAYDRQVLVDWLVGWLAIVSMAYCVHVLLYNAEKYMFHYMKSY